MLRNNVESILITENSKPIGVISDRELLREIVDNQKDPKKTLARDLEYTPLITLDEGELVTSALKTMREKGASRIAVVKNGQLVGMLTEDLAQSAKRDVAVKTGTTNDSRDAWIMGYTPSIAVGAWAGNNNNSPMVKKVAGLIVAPMWRAFMDQVVVKYPNEQFEEPLVLDKLQLKPVLQGIWQGGLLSTSTSGASTVYGGVHSILNWVSKDDPKGPIPENQSLDSQFNNWEYGVRLWAQDHGLSNDQPFVID